MDISLYQNHSKYKATRLKSRKKTIKVFCLLRSIVRFVKRQLRVLVYVRTNCNCFSMFLDMMLLSNELSTFYRVEEAAFTGFKKMSMLLHPMPLDRHHNSLPLEFDSVCSPYSAHEKSPSRTFNAHMAHYCLKGIISYDDFLNLAIDICNYPYCILSYNERITIKNIIYIQRICFSCLYFRNIICAFIHDVIHRRCY